MAHQHKVVSSHESPCGLRCVDIIAVATGGFGWASYRRDPEDGTGWHSDGLFAHGFDSADAARAAAQRDVAWLGEI